jgi:hypothetical protein
MSFNKNNTGSITFLGNGKIKGRMKWLGDFEFFGKEVVRERVVWPKSVPGWKSQWRGFNERAYESERVGRWDGGSGWLIMLTTITNLPFLTATPQWVKILRKEMKATSIWRTERT